MSGARYPGAARTASRRVSATGQVVHVRYKYGDASGRERYKYSGC